MAYSVEKIRIAEGDMLGARRYLLPHVCHYDFAAHNAEHTVVNRHDRAMPAEMLAAAAGLGRSDHAIAAARNNQVSVFRERGHPRRSGTSNARRSSDTIGSGCAGWSAWATLLCRVADSSRPVRSERGGFFSAVACALIRSAKLTNPPSNSPPKIVRDSHCPQILRIHWRVETVATDMRSGILFPQRGNQFRRQSRCRMHRQINRNQRSRTNHVSVQFLTRQIKARHLVAAVDATMLAGDTTPNGWRPNSYVEISTIFIDPSIPSRPIAAVFLPSPEG